MRIRIFIVLVLAMVLLLCGCESETEVVQGEVEHYEAYTALGKPIIIGGKDIGYVDGEYFSENRKKGCYNTSLEGGRCHKQKDVSYCENDHPLCTCMRYWPTGNKNDCQVDLRAVQCQAYAHYCQWVLFGDYPISDAELSAKGFVDLTGKVPGTDCTAEKLKELFLNVPAGTHLRVSKHASWGNDHSICLISSDENGVTYTDANMDGHCQIRIYTITWQEFASVVQSYRNGILYAYAKKSSELVKRVYNGTDFTEYVYDEDGVLLESYECEYHGYRRTGFWYDPEGNKGYGMDYSMFEVNGHYYHENGLLVKHEQLNSRGQVSDYEKYTYNDHGDPVVRETASSKSTHEYTYYDDGKIKTDAYYKHGMYKSLQYEKTYTYDDLGRIIKIDSKSSSHKIYTYEYDAHGNLTREVQYNYEGKKERETVNHWHSNGQLLHQVITGSDGQITHEIIREFDAMGRIVSHEEKYSTGMYERMLVTYEYTYSDSPTKMCARYFNREDGTLVFEEFNEYTYDQYGFLKYWKGETPQHGLTGEIDFSPYYK